LIKNNFKIQKKVIIILKKKERLTIKTFFPPPFLLRERKKFSTAESLRGYFNGSNFTVIYG